MLVRAVVEDYADCALASSLLLHSTVVAVAAAALVLSPFTPGSLGHWCLHSCASSSSS